MIQTIIDIITRKKLSDFPSNYDFRGCLDSPRDNDTCLTIKGWVLSKRKINKIELFFLKDKLCDVILNKDRRDAKKAHTGYPNENNGFEFNLTQKQHIKYEGQKGHIYFRFYIDGGKYIDKYKTLVRFPDIKKEKEPLNNRTTIQSFLKLHTSTPQRGLEKFPPEYDFRGHLDSPEDNENCINCTGWFLTKKSLYKAEFIIGEEKIFDIKKNTIRPDVALARSDFSNNSKHGFDHPVPRKYLAKYAGKRALVFLRCYMNKREYVDVFKTPVKFPKNTSFNPLVLAKRKLASILGLKDIDNASDIKRFQGPLDKNKYEKERITAIPKTDIKLIAFYFPQFHPFPENDKFWGKGYTEWTNVTKALPHYEGHYQPRLPGELGFYDLRIKDVMKRQIELARQHGIYGFCFHHYWFSGKPVMRVPYNQMLENPDLDIPFCLHWANEPWTVQWDGCLKSGVLLDQSHSPRDDMAFIKDIEPALKDRRYIKIDGRPLLIIYRPGLFLDIKATLQRWNDYCEKKGIGKLYLAVMQSCFEEVVDPRIFGFDAAIEYPPHNMRIKKINEKVKLFDPDFQGNIVDHPYLVAEALKRDKPAYTLFRGLFPEWDCTPRRDGQDIYVGSSPSLYGKWLDGLCKYTRKSLPAKERFIFINAWNEWGEGAYMEPDRKYGYAYLNKTADVLSHFPIQSAASRVSGEKHS